MKPNKRMILHTDINNEYKGKVIVPSKTLASHFDMRQHNQVSQ